LRAINNKCALIIVFIITIIFSIPKNSNSEEYKLTPFKLKRYKAGEVEKIDNVLFDNESNNVSDSVISPQSLTIWIKGGLQLSTFIGSDFLGNNRYNPQWIAELAIEYRFHRYFAVGTSIGYSRKGAILTPYKITIDYVYITPHIKFYPVDYFFFMLGPSFNIRTIDSVTPKLLGEIGSGISKSMAYGITFGIGVVVPIDFVALSIEIRNDFSLTQILTDRLANGSVTTFYDIQFIFGVGFIF
jgi:hypothetical protein